MGQPDHEVPRLILPPQRASRLLLPNGYRFAEQLLGALLLPDLGIYLASHDSSPVLRSRLRQMPVEEFLAAVSRVSWLNFGGANKADLRAGMERQGWDPKLSFRDYQFAYAVAILLENYDYPSSRRWPGEDVSSQLWTLHEVSQLVNGVLADADRDLSATPDHDRAGVLLMRRANQQFHEFEHPAKPLVRPYLLLTRFARPREQKLGISLDDVLRGKYGLGLVEWFALAFGLFAVFIPSDKGQLFERDFLAASTDFPGLIPERLGRLLDAITLDYEGFRREWQNDRYGRQPGFELFNLNPLLQYPVIRTENDRYVIPAASFFYRRVTTGLIFNLLDAGNQSGAVGDILGSAVEGYVRQLLNDLPGNGVLRRVPEVAGEKRCDFAYVDGDITILIECKRKSLTQPSRTTGLRQDIRDSLADQRGGVADGIEQLITTARAVQAGRVAGVPHNGRLILMLVTLDHFYMANSPYISRIIDEILSDRAVARDDFDYQICPVPELEEACALLSSTGGSLGALLASKVDDSEHRTWDLSQWMRTVLQAAWQQAGGKLATIPSHAELLNNWTDEVYKCFRHPQEAA